MHRFSIEALDHRRTPIGSHIIDVDAQARPIMPQPFPALWEQTCLTNNNPVVRAPEAGFFTDSDAALVERRKTHLKRGKVYFFRHNRLTAETARVSCKAEHGSSLVAYIRRLQELSMKAQNWQREALDIPTTASANFSDGWFVSWVASTTTHENYMLCLRNLCLESHRVLAGRNDSESPPPDGQTRIQRADYIFKLFCEEQVSYHARLLDTKIHAASINHNIQRHMATNRATNRAIVETWKTEMDARISEVSHYDPAPPEMKFEPAYAGIPADSVLYVEMTRDERLKYWSDRISNDVVASFYKLVYDVVALKANWENSHISQLMRMTISIAADEIWNEYIMPILYPGTGRAENNIGKIRDTFKGAADQAAASIEGFPEGISGIWVYSDSERQRKDKDNTEKSARKLEERSGPANSLAMWRRA
ncbi:uncharacterized protein K452DRAFT_336063 [Aplosporella prunicola CBS 121167]|uniref:Uncharacterized protein n=1 Tax=Aplosporella prunicola CBS 121167 TaxID=1176127 RepID=A0A6A6B9S8_9PEZI|nr:uncharacterized protein K452DRAFT_336063 [Aplosporella prunicola CBS 121167]KAF2140065.1 hypothetical protein K452DRAFT_336063 [Aplosporella prunicola CBS 121167]